MHKILLFIILQTFPVTCFANNAIPDKLFGITLGGVYKVDSGDLPVKKIIGFTGEWTFSVDGYEYFYFEPIDGSASQIFPYIEQKTKHDDEVYETSFRLCVLPIIPTDIDSVEKLKGDIKAEVVSIIWKESAKEKDQITNYNWAGDLCKIFQAHFSIKPKIIDNYESKLYICRYTSNDKEFEVYGSIFEQRVSLHYKREVLNKKTDAVVTTLRKLFAKKIILGLTTK